MTRVALLCAASLFGASGLAQARAVVEPKSGVAFQSMRQVGERALELVGVGLRKKFLFKICTVAIYVDEHAAREAVRSARERGQLAAHGVATPADARALLLGGGFARLGVVHLLHDASAGRIRDQVQDALEQELSDRSPPALREEARRFVALFDRDLHEGDELSVYAGPDGALTVDLGGQKRTAPRSPRILRSLLLVLLGPDAPDELRQGLTSRIDVIGF
jgi:hypothetical protein